MALFCMRAAFVGLMLQLAASCTPPIGYKKKCRDQRFMDAKNIVYGKFEREIPLVANRTNKKEDFFDYEFQVYCIMRMTQGPINETIKIDKVFPGTCHMEDMSLTKVGKEAIILVHYSAAFRSYSLDQVNLQSAIYAATPEMLSWVASIFKVSNKPALPSGCCASSRPSSVSCIFNSTSTTPQWVATCGAMVTMGQGYAASSIVVLMSILMSYF